MNDIKKALDSGMRHIHFDEGLVLNKYRHRRNLGMNTFKVAMAALILIAVCLTTETAQSAFAYVYRSIANIMQMNERVEEYTTVIGKSVTDKDITVTLNDVIVSEEKLIVSLNFSDGDKLDEQDGATYWGSKIKVLIDGKEMPMIGLSGTGQKIDDYTFNNIVEYYVGSITAEEEHEFKIKITEIAKASNGVSGDWTFDFRANGKAMAGDTKVIMLNNILKYDGYNIIFEKFVSNSYEKLLYVSYSDGAGYGDRGNEFNLIGVDNLGNEVKLYAQPNYYNKQDTIFICWGGTDISDQASALILQIDDQWPYEYDASKESVTINLK